MIFLLVVIPAGAQTSMPALPQAMLDAGRPPAGAFAWLQKIGPQIDLALLEQDTGAAEKLRPYLSDTAWHELEAFMQPDISVHTNGRTIYRDVFPAAGDQGTNACLPVGGHECWGITYDVIATPGRDGGTDDHPQSISLIALGPDSFQIVSLFSADGETGNQ
jgi:hypothetical protein